MCHYLQLLTQISAVRKCVYTYVDICDVEMGTLFHVCRSNTVDDPYIVRSNTVDDPYIVVHIGICVNI